MFATLSFVLSACGPSSLEEYREEGRETVLLIVQTLEAIDSRETLIQSAPQLKQLFNRLVDLIMAAQEYRFEHSESEIPSFSDEDRNASDQLLFQLNKIYHIEGGREVIEKCQEEALLRLGTVPKRNEN